MSTSIEAFLRSIGIVVLIAILGYVANATNLTDLIGPQWAYIIAGLAAIAINQLDKVFSPDGTVVGGTIGVRR